MIPALGLFALFSLGLPPAADLQTPPCPTHLPEPEALSEETGLPDPLSAPGGRPVMNPDGWPAARRRILGVLLFYEYGCVPPPPRLAGTRTLKRESVLEGRGVRTVYELRFERSAPREDRDGNPPAFRLRVEVVTPSGKGPFPAILKEDAALDPLHPATAAALARGYVFARYLRTDLAPDAPGRPGPAQAAYPEYDWGVLAVWAWGASRALDFLSTLDSVDARRVLITGHSRGGKTALLAAALDERFKAVVANASGTGGAALYRVAESGAETLEAITNPKRFAYWFHPRLRKFAGRVRSLPFDQHFLLAAIAPRALLLTESRDDRWANPAGVQAAYLEARKIYRFLGKEDAVGIHTRTGPHDQTALDWEILLDFADWKLRGKPSSPQRFSKLPYPERAPRR